MSRYVSISDEKPVPSPLRSFRATENRASVSISDEKPVPSPRTMDPSGYHAICTFQSQMRSQFPRHVYVQFYRWHDCLFQSQMRSQFPRHSQWLSAVLRRDCVSISDEKPVPSPQFVGDGMQRANFVFQSQMRSQFPRHGQSLVWWGCSMVVSISDEKPVPSPRSYRLR